MAGAQVFRVSSIFVKLDKIRSFLALWALVALRFLLDPLPILVPV
jgi:hypothetical protein